jgi:hypothetical protein
MEIVCSAVFPAAEQTRAKTREAVQIECHQHWAMLILPALFLVAWVAIGGFFVSILTTSFNVFGQEPPPQAPRIMTGMFAGSALLIALLYWHSYRRCTLRLTSYSATLQTGPLFHGAGRINLDRAKVLSIHQSPIGRALNFGTISIVGSGQERLRLRFVPNPAEFYKKLTFTCQSNN